jgi:hypothetical protein
MEAFAPCANAGAAAASASATQKHTWDRLREIKAPPP